MCKKNIRKISVFPFVIFSAGVMSVSPKYGQCSISSELIKILCVENIGRVIPIQLFKNEVHLHSLLLLVRNALMALK